ncbi:hypothetical protein V6N13_017805 [Hibiscus sabdariffa]
MFMNSDNSKDQALPTFNAQSKASKYDGSAPGSSFYHKACGHMGLHRVANDGTNATGVMANHYLAPIEQNGLGDQNIPPIAAEFTASAGRRD